MIKTQEMVSFPIFAENGQKIQPDTAKYSAGFQESDVLPAEWVNYFENKSSSAITTLNAGITSIEEELNSLVVAGGQSPTSTDNSQVLKSIQYLINQAVKQSALASYPIGALYWSSNPKNPSELFGGTWKQIKDKFILSAGDSYTVDSTGGNSKITLGVGNLPAHSHGMNHHHYTSGTTGATDTNHTHSGATDTRNTNHTHYFSWTGSHSHTLHRFPLGGGSYGFGTNDSHNNYGDFESESASITVSGNTGACNNENESVQHAHGFTTGYMNQNWSHSHSWGNWSGDSYNTSNNGTRYSTDNTGSGTAFSIMPPYVVKYCWERTA